jgi:membrane protease YdiL (CAAX protease family)
MPHPIAANHRLPLFRIAASLFLLAAIWLAVRMLTQSATASAAWKIAGLAGGAVGCLLIAVMWVLPLIWRQRKNRPLSILELIAAIYIIPILAVALPIRLGLLFISQPDAFLFSLFRNEWLRLSAPWFFLIQACILTLVLTPKLVASARAGWEAEQRVDWPIVIFSGLGLWLLGAFVFVLVSRLLGGIDLPALAPSIPLSLLSGMIALGIIPLGEEYLFRKILIERLQPRFGQYGAWFTSAALFATLQIRPLLWLPAFFLGLGLCFISAHTGKLRNAVLVHVVFNAFALALSWATVL